MNILQLRCLVAIADEGSFSRAGLRLGMSQPAVSLQIRRLEERLGDAVFLREGRRVTLTLLGEAILPHAREALRAIGDIETTAEHLRGAVTGSVAFGTIPGCGGMNVPEMLARFHQSYPLVSLHLTEATADDLIRQVTRHELDGAIVATAAPSSHGLPHRVLRRSRLVAVAPAGHPLASTSAIRTRELLEHELMCTPEGSGIRAALESATAALGAYLRVRFESSTPDMLVELAALGLGVAVVPDDDTLRARGDIAVIDVFEPIVTGNIELIWTSQSAVSPPVRELLQLAREL